MGPRFREDDGGFREDEGSADRSRFREHDEVLKGRAAALTTRWTDYSRAFCSPLAIFITRCGVAMP
jgi:hypothetical protein